MLILTLSSQISPIVRLASAMLLLAVTPTLSSPGMLEFPVNPVDLGTLQQGDLRQVELKVRNPTAVAVALETAMSQNVGASEFQFPKSIGPGAEGLIRFTLNSAFMDGPFEHNIILVETDGTPHVGQIKGIVNTPLELSERLFDVGYLKDKDKSTLTFYIWGKSGDKDFPLTLNAESAQWCDASFEKVKLDVSDFEHVREGGTTFGYKVTLAAKFAKFPNSDPRSREKSIRRIVGFQSSKWPKATPEVLLVGYWK